MRYFIYTRKSTEDEDKQVLSIEAQLAELKEFAAKEPGRTKFAEMLSLIEKGKADGILAWHPDRLAQGC